jgi:hypothetical protein
MSEGIGYLAWLYGQRFPGEPDPSGGVGDVAFLLDLDHVTYWWWQPKGSV